jgi:hypothetical protein
VPVFNDSARLSALLYTRPKAIPLSSVTTVGINPSGLSEEHDAPITAGTDTPSFSSLSNVRAAAGMIGIAENSVAVLTVEAVLAAEASRKTGDTLRAFKS